MAKKYNADAAAAQAAEALEAIKAADAMDQEKVLEVLLECMAGRKATAPGSRCAIAS
jgi:hypothetical protein